MGFPPRRFFPSPSWDRARPPSRTECYSARLRGRHRALSLTRFDDIDGHANLRRSVGIFYTIISNTWPGIIECTTRDSDFHCG